jgi:hypothetical protein
MMAERANGRRDFVSSKEGSGLFIPQSDRIYDSKFKETENSSGWRPVIHANANKSGSFLDLLRSLLISLIDPVQVRIVTYLPYWDQACK